MRSLIALVAFILLCGCTTGPAPTAAPPTGGYNPDVPTRTPSPCVMHCDGGPQGIPPRIAIDPTTTLAPTATPTSTPITITAPPGIAAPDPRLPDAGFRLLSDVPVAATATEADYDRHRLALGLPDGARDLEPEKTVLLEAGFDELQGISWTKGCYMGQELTARTKYRGLLKRRLVPVAIDGALPAPGTPVLRDGAEIGTMRSGLGQRGLAVIRIDALGFALRCGEAMLHPDIPAWMSLPEAASRPV